MPFYEHQALLVYTALADGGYALVGGPSGIVALAMKAEAVSYVVGASPNAAPWWVVASASVGDRAANHSLAAGARRLHEARPRVALAEYDRDSRVFAGTEPRVLDECLESGRLRIMAGAGPLLSLAAKIANDQGRLIAGTLAATRTGRSFDSLPRPLVRSAAVVVGLPDASEIASRRASIAPAAVERLHEPWLEVA